MAYTSVTYADISSGTEVRRTEPKCPHISKLSKERLVGARKAPTSRLKRRHTAATRGTALSIEASRLDRATDRCSCKRSPRTAHSQTGGVANVHHARRTARSLGLPRSSCVYCRLGPPQELCPARARRRGEGNDARTLADGVGHPHHRTRLEGSTASGERHAALQIYCRRRAARRRARQQLATNRDAELTA